MNHPSEIESFAIHLAKLEAEGYVLAGFICFRKDNPEKTMIIPSQLIAHAIPDEVGKFLNSMCGVIYESRLTGQTTDFIPKGAIFKSDN